MSDSPRILAVDDNEEGLFALTSLLSQQGMEPLPASNGREALEIAQQEEPDLILLDVNMPGMDGYEVTRKLKSDPVLRYIPVLLLTARGEPDEVEHGLAQGADGHIQKPYESRELIARVSAALRMRRLYRDLHRTTEENRNLRERVRESTGLKKLIGGSGSMAEVQKLIEKVKDSKLPVLITGESGTGKELVAYAIHQSGSRAEMPFIPQNCSALSETLLESELFGHVKGAFTGAITNRIGLFEAADGGTLFLDEIGEMKSSLQAKLLRVLQDGSFTPVGATRAKHVDVRIVAATNRNLEQMIKEGTFREDLFYRLNVIRIQMPPLRERSDDIPSLIDHFLVAIAERERKPVMRISDELKKALCSYKWPGNVRELQNEMERLVLLSSDSDEIDPIYWTKSHGSLQPGGAASSSGDSLPAAILELERSMITKVLNEVGGNKSEAARILGISRSNLIAKVSTLGIESE